MPTYDLRYRRSNGVLALQYVIQAISDKAAEEIADQYWTPRYAALEIWRGTE
jgi:hypothetical protein